MHSGPLGVVVSTCYM